MVDSLRRRTVKLAEPGEPIECEMHDAWFRPFPGDDCHRPDYALSAESCSEGVVFFDTVLQRGDEALGLDVGGGLQHRGCVLSFNRIDEPVARADCSRVVHYLDVHGELSSTSELQPRTGDGLCVGAWSPQQGDLALIRSG